MRHAYRCHASPAVLDLDRSAPQRNSQRYLVDSEALDTARCPCCRAPLVARMGREGPYFHCRCREISSRGRG